MKINFTELHLTKMSTLAKKCHSDEASLTDLIQLKLLMSAFKSSLIVNDRNPNLIAQLDDISNLA